MARWLDVHLREKLGARLGRREGAQSAGRNAVAGTATRGRWEQTSPSSPGDGLAASDNAMRAKDTSHRLPSVSAPQGTEDTCPHGDVHVNVHTLPAGAGLHRPGVPHRPPFAKRPSPQTPESFQTPAEPATVSPRNSAVTAWIVTTWTRFQLSSLGGVLS